MKTYLMIKLTKTDINKVYGGINSDEQNDPEIGIGLETTKDFLGGLKKVKIDVNNRPDKIVDV